MQVTQLPIRKTKQIKKQNKTSTSSKFGFASLKDRYLDARLARLARLVEHLYEKETQLLSVAVIY